LWRYALRFWRLLGKVPAYDAVFVHMNPEYIVLAGWWWRLAGKKVSLWYTLKSVNLKLRVAVLFANFVFTASSESFRLATSKVRVVGHGIDTELFALRPQRPADLRIATFGRIAPSKRLIEMLGGLDTLQVRGAPFAFDIAGAPVMEEDKAYEERLWDEVKKRPYANSVKLAGVVPYRELPAWYKSPPAR